MAEKEKKVADKLDFESALRNVIAELKAPKDKRNTFGNYSYRNAEAILEAVKPLLYKYELRVKATEEVVHFTSDDELQVVELIDSKGKKYTEIIGGDRYYIKSTVVVTGYGDTDTASAMAREEQNKKGMDGAQVTGAAGSYAKKYALSHMFDIDDNKDADSQDNSNIRKSAAKEPDGYITEEQRQTIAKLLVNDGIMVDEIPTILAEHFEVPLGSSISFEKATSIIEKLKTPPEE